MSLTYSTLYQKSQESSLPNISFSLKTKRLYKEYKSLKQIDEIKLQKLADLICSDFSVPSVYVLTMDIWRHNIRKGLYQRRLFSKSSIIIYKYIISYDSPFSQKRTVEEMVYTLLHELVHHFDYELFGLEISIHSYKFYERIKQLKGLLS